METTIISFVVIGAIAGFVGGLINMLLWRHTLRHKKLFGIKLHAGFSALLKQSFDSAMHQPGTGNLQKIQENIINLFDDFMANKLTQKMPVLSMFIDEQLISEIRVIFHAEMEESLPKLLNRQLNVNDSSGISILIQQSITKALKKYRNQAIVFLILGMFAGGIVGLMVYYII